MKKNLSFIMLLICAISLQAQVVPTITPVTYRGAFAPAPTPMWTDGWTNWDPQNTNYGNTIDSIINTPITSNRVLSGTKTYRLQGLVYVKNGATLTIRPGCILKGDPLVANSSLIITRGSKIIANGSKTNPIVFTSNAAIGQRQKGDWGGIIILGKAHLNAVGGQNFIEGIAQSPDTQYGGGLNPDDDDSSGSLNYVRIEFGGYIFQTNQEINGLTMGAVGRKTSIQNVQVSFANDDAYEWFGGSVNCRYLVSYRNLDDDWDTDFGYNGTVQFALGVRDPNIADNPLVSTSEGFESDNDPSTTGNPLLKPYTTGLFSNITEIGPLRGDTSSLIASGYRRAVRIRRNSHLRIVNSVLTDFATGVFIDGINSVTAAQANTVNPGNSNPGNLVFKNNIIAGNKVGRTLETNQIWNMAGWFGANNNDSLGTSTAGLLTTPYNYLAPDYRPAIGSLARMKANFNDSAFYHVDTTGALTSLIICPTVPTTPATIVGPTAVCSLKTNVDTVKYYMSAKSISGILRNVWTVPAGFTIVKGQGTDTIWVTIAPSFTNGTLGVRNQSYCGAFGPTRSLSLFGSTPGNPTKISGPLSNCGRLNIPLTYSTPAVAGTTTYLWTIPVGAILNGSGTGNTISVTYPTLINGSMSVSAQNACGTSLAKVITISRVAKPRSITGTTVVCANDILVYTVVDTANIAGTTYTWTVPAGATFTGQNTNSITVTYPATITPGTITVKARNCNNNSGILSVNITSGSCFGRPAKSINQELTTGMVVYPNPATSEFTLNVKGIQSEVPATLQIVNTFGQVVRQETVKTFTGTVNRKISNLSLPAGIYYVKFNNGVETYTQKVVIK